PASVSTSRLLCRCVAPASSVPGVDARPACFLFSDPAPSEIYTLSLHDALPIFRLRREQLRFVRPLVYSRAALLERVVRVPVGHRSEEHTSELQSRRDLVCRLLLEKKNRRPGCGPRRASRSESAIRTADGTTADR